MFVAICVGFMFSGVSGDMFFGKLLVMLCCVGMLSRLR